MSVARGRPRAEAGGRSGSITNHSASVGSLSYRRPLRLYCRRVISVQTIVLSLESLQIRRNHNWLKSLSFFFSPALRLPHLFLSAGYFIVLLMLGARPGELLRFIAFGAAYVLGLAPTLIANAIDAGSMFATTYSGADTVPPDF